MFKKLKAFLTRKLVTVTFYMKSGNTIVADRVVSPFTVSVQGNAVTGVSKWEQFSPRNKVMLITIDLSQIEAISHTV
jgi:hypothetical protein